MKLLFINPVIRLSDKPRHIPHGLAIIANIIRREFPEISIDFLDLNALRPSHSKIIEFILHSKPDVVMTGGLIPVYSQLITLSHEIKSLLPECIIIAGGSAAMSIPELLLSRSSVDIVAMGEGEIIAPEIIRELLENPQTRNFTTSGIAYIKDGVYTENPGNPLITDMDSESALPAWDLLPMDVYLSNPIVGVGRDIDFISSRGCPYRCTFCYQPWGRAFRAHSAAYIADAVMKLKKEYSIDFVSFQDDEFMVSRKRVVEFCELHNKHFPDLRWSCTGRVNLVNDDIVKLMVESGCTSISYGFESGSPRILHEMNKNATLDQMSNALEINRKALLPVPVSFIIGMPGETMESCDETLSFALENNIKLDSLMFATPYPGTQLFDDALKSGLISKEKLHDFVMNLGDARDFVINLTSHFTDEELINKRSEMMKIAEENYKTPTFEQIKDNIRKLYGPLATHFFDVSDDDAEHRAKHGSIGMF
ncbi:MAG: B12-binding domain-containing radical SAM protein [Deltaproteobacteria bacterium]|nr:B12-binding domain-containing radical SAM protein [Deltaproteobacteria bacterium]